MKIVAIVQARMGSSRLPGKVLKEICGRSAIELLLTRLSRSKLINEIVVATSTKKENDRLCEEVKSLGFNYFRGSELDVLGRSRLADTGGHLPGFRPLGRARAKAD